MKLVWLSVLAACLVAVPPATADHFTTAEIFLVRYAESTWDPCTYDGHGVGTCFAINCGLEGCKTPAEAILCPTMQCVKDALNRRGKDHLTGVYRLRFVYANPQAVEVQELSVVESFDIVEEKGR